MTFAQRLARATTAVAVASPRLWRLLRGPFRRYFTRLAPRWDTIVGPDHLAALTAALAHVPPPRRALDVGTARVLAPGGTLLVSFSEGAKTPIWIPTERLQRELVRRGFVQFHELAVGAATCIRARRW